MAETLLAMATDLVLAQIRVQGLAPEEMHTALTETYHCLRTLQATW
jgi:hypothetical protein